MPAKTASKEEAEPPLGGLLVATEVSPMVHAPLGTLEAITASFGWNNEPFSLLTLVDWTTALTYGPDLEALAVDIVTVATRQQASRLVIAVTDEYVGETVAAKLRRHPILRDWLDIRYHMLPRAARHELTALVVMDGGIQTRYGHSLARLVRENFGLSRYAVLATARGINDLIAGDQNEKRLFFQIRRAVGYQSFDETPYLPIGEQVADAVILVTDERQESTLQRAARLTRLAVRETPVFAATISHGSDGYLRLKRQF